MRLFSCKSLTDCSNADFDQFVWIFIHLPIKVWIIDCFFGSCYVTRLFAKCWEFCGKPYRINILFVINHCKQLRYFCLHAKKNRLHNEQEKKNFKP